MAHQKLVRALFSAFITESLFLNQGELWAADDPLVRQHPDWFTSDLEPMTRRSGPPVESATADPGEKRATRARVADPELLAPGA